MKVDLTLSGIAFESLSAKVHQRVNAKRAHSSFMVESIELSIGDVQADGAESPVRMLSLTFTHRVKTIDEDDKPFWDASAEVRAFLSSSEIASFEPERAQEVAEAALRLAMPVSATRLKDLCLIVGIHPTPSIPMFVVADLVAEEKGST